MADPGYSLIGGSGIGSGGGSGTGPDFGIDLSIRGGIIGGAIRGSAATILHPFSQSTSVHGTPLVPMPFGPFAVMDLSLGAGVALATQGVNQAILKKSFNGTPDYTAMTRLIRPSASPAGGYQDTLIVPLPLACLESFVVTVSSLLGGAVGGWAVNMYGTTSSLLMYATLNNNVTVGASTSAYQTPGQSGNMTLTEVQAGVTIPYAATARNLCVAIYTSQPASGSLVITLRKNGAGTGLTITIPLSAVGTLGVIFRDTVNTVSFAAGDWFTWELTNNATGASGAIASVSMELAPTTPSNLGIWFPKAALGFTASANNYYNAYAGNGRTATETDAWSPITRTGTATALYAYVTTAPANTITVTIQINGTPSSITGTITSGGGTGSLLIWSGSVAITNLDCVTINYATGSSTQGVVASAALCFVAA